MRQDTTKVADDRPVDNVGSDKRLSQQIWRAVLYLTTLIARLRAPSCSSHMAPRDPVITEDWDLLAFCCTANAVLAVCGTAKEARLVHPR